MAEKDKGGKAESKEGKAAGGGLKKQLIFGALIVVVAAAGGAGSWFLLGNKQAAAKHGQADGSASEAGAEEVVEEEPAEEASAPIYQPLEPIVVNLSGGSEAVMRVAISVQLRSEQDKEKLTAFMPRIQGDLMLLFSSKTDSELLTQEGKLALIEQARHTINKAMGATPKTRPKELPVQGVSFTEMIIQ